MKILFSLFLILLGLYLVLGVGLYFAQRQLIFYPQPYTQTRYPELAITNQNASISVLCVNTPDNCQPKGQRAIIYFGGNAEAVMHSAPLLERMLPKDTAIYLVNYRGYGTSQGKPFEAALISDAKAVYDAVYQQLCQNAGNINNTNAPRIDVIGRSIGTGVASALASERQVDKLVLITPFDSLQAVAQNKFKIYPLSLLLKDKFRSDKRAASIDSNVLLLIAGNDQVIAPDHARLLLQAFNRPVAHHTLPTAAHNDIMTYPKAQNYLQAFLQD